MYTEDRLKSTFTLMSAGNGVVAIVAGLIAQVTSDALGDIGPFQVAIGLTFVALLLTLRWPENYGVKQGGLFSLLARIREGAGVIWRRCGALIVSVTRFSLFVVRPKILLLGTAQAFFEGAVYTFGEALFTLNKSDCSNYYVVFMWVPTLQKLAPGTGNLPTGLVFSCFMLCVTVGGILFGLLHEYVS
jgi:hypothetical protein